MAINISASPLIVDLGPAYIYGTVSHYPPIPPNDVYDKTITLTPGILTLEISGDWPNLNFIGTLTIDLSIEGIFVVGVVVNGYPLEVTAEISADAYVEHGRKNVVQWSRVGYLNFDLKEDNIAGERPLNWDGYVYKLIKLGKSIIVYGQGGVTALTPHDVHYGLEGIYPVGVKGHAAAVGTDTGHFFVDTYGRLYKVSLEGVQKLGYSEFLSPMNNIVLSLDTEKNLLYLCDGVSGYIFNTKDQSFGTGPANISGIGVRGSTKYVVSYEDVVTPKFQICTDIYDMEIRKFKTIHNIEVGVDLQEHLELQIDYRIGNRDAFSSTPWYLINPSGIAYCPCYGLEFKFRIRSFIYEFFKIDRLKINGSIHGISFRDYLATMKQNL